MRRGDHHEIVVRASSVIKLADGELYTWLASAYLPTRFPTLFALRHEHLHLVTSKSLNLQPPSDRINALELLGGILDNEFMLLLPTKEGEYEVQGCVACFPSGFGTNEQFGMRLKDIHGPVLGYKEKLDKSIDIFFEKLEVRRVVRRSNWSRPRICSE